ncbi:MAG: preprotein translocase subunit SecA [Verrucomicrobiae bacterium]|nr:preprotein translocase subunit SecA [Verrucomicrobiae bacterium]MDW7980998.1 preprotein translocase subunit SecA [Verrucomicrobiales bacterium]
MIGYLIKKIFGTKNEREVRRLRNTLVPKINELEQQYQALSDEQIRAKTDEFKRRIEQGRKERGYYAHIERARKLESELRSDEAKLERRKAFEIEQAILDELLPEAFAVVKNVCRRLVGKTIMVRGHPVVWDMIPFDVQLIGAWALHNGRIAEMATGEGKTLVATMPVYLNALLGHGVHVVTVNDYLAARDAEWMGEIYKFLGLTVGCIQHDQPPHVRRQQYLCDVTYGTCAEFGFDYLRDNGMATRKEDQVQRGHYYAIIDEVDSILIDEARTPLIISGPSIRALDNEYAQYKPQVEALVRAQERLCKRYLEEAESLLRKLQTDGELDPDEKAELQRRVGVLLFRVKTGMPKSEGLLRLLENPENLKLLNRIETELHLDQKKAQLFAEKEELYFAIDEKNHDADLTEKGRTFLSPNDPNAFVLPDLAVAMHEIDTGPETDARKRMEAKRKLQEEFEAKAQRIHCISQLLKAYCLYFKDVHYVVQDNKVIIVDQNTGRLMPGRRWSDGLHQAVEAKEGVEIERETQTLATITIQNYFRMYQKLAGMTGTAETEAAEFWDIYKLGVMVIPTNKPCIRKDWNDSVYKTKREKYNAVINEIKQIHAQGRPILVGTISVEVSEHLSRMLQKERIPHSVLNAKYHQLEAEIVARAGQRGAVTIATNMAGRGTDIKLGPGVAELGGLHVIGTERHEARRIDRQLRGRCARQGDPGSSHFFISLEDDLMRLFGSERIVKYMEKMGLEEGQELQHPLLNRSIEQAQKRVEQHNFQIRKRTLEYDDVMNKQREVVYGFRNQIIHAEDVRDRLMDIIEEVIVEKVAQLTTPEPDLKDWKIRQLADWINLTFPIGLTEEHIKKAAETATQAPLKGSIYEGLSPAQFAVCNLIFDAVRKAYELKISFENPDALKVVERYIILTAIDRLWQEHLYEMDSLRYSIGLRTYGQRDPLIEYKVEAKKLFDEMMVNVKTEICKNIFQSASSLFAFENYLRSLPQQTLHQTVSAFGGSGTKTTSTTAAAPQPQQRRPSDIVSEAAAAVERAKPVWTGPKVGRNDPCPCGSGKKYKHCCGK